MLREAALTSVASHLCGTKTGTETGHGARAQNGKSRPHGTATGELGSSAFCTSAATVGE